MQDFGPPMSASGQKRTFRSAIDMSALPLKADIRGREPLMNQEEVAAFSSCEFGSASVVGN
jgi:hypothetical protein